MIEELLKGTFIHGIGINSEQLVIDFANNSLLTTYRLWVDTPIECELKSDYANKGLQDEEVELLAINQLRYLTIKDVKLSSNDDLLIAFESDVNLKISGSSPKTNRVEPWRLYQLTPEERTLLIVCNK